MSEFTVRDGLAWLGIPWEVYVESAEILRGRHGNPIQFALLDARAAQGTDTSPAQVLSKHGADHRAGRGVRAGAGPVR